MKRMRTYLTILAIPLVFMACPGDEEDDYVPPEDEGSGSIMGPSASAAPLEIDASLVLRIG